MHKRQNGCGVRRGGGGWLGFAVTFRCFVVRAIPGNAFVCHSFLSPRASVAWREEGNDHVSLCRIGVGVLGVDPEMRLRRQTAPGSVSKPLPGVLPSA